MRGFFLFRLIPLSSHQTLPRSLRFGLDLSHLDAEGADGDTSDSSSDDDDNRNARKNKVKDPRWEESLDVGEVEAAADDNEGDDDDKQASSSEDSEEREMFGALNKKGMDINNNNNVK